LPPILSTIQRPDDRTDDRASGADDVASGLTLRKLRFQMIDDRAVPWKAIPAIRRRRWLVTAGALALRESIGDRQATGVKIRIAYLFNLTDLARLEQQAGDVSRAIPLSQKAVTASARARRGQHYSLL
jgi:hypothetical protein